MIQFVLSLASLPQILVLAVLVACLLWISVRQVPAVILSAHHEPMPVRPGDIFFSESLGTLAPGMLPGTSITVGRFGFPIMLAWVRFKLLLAGIRRLVLIATVALMVALGLHIVVGIASALFTPRAIPAVQERSASFQAY